MILTVKYCVAIDPTVDKTLREKTLAGFTHIMRTMNFFNLPN